MVNLREEFNRVLSNYGYYVLIMHNNKKRRCTCFNDKTREGNKDCPYCYGLGYTPVIEKHLCRSKVTTTSRNMSSSLRMTDYGEVLYPTRCYYLKHDVKVAPNDYIIECDFEDGGRPILSNYSIYNVAFTESLRGDRGRSEYNRVYCDLDPVNMDLIIANLRKNGNRLFYELGFRR